MNTSESSSASPRNLSRFLKTSTPNAAALVRSVECWPGVRPPDDGPDLPNTQARYWSPISASWSQWW